MPSLSSVSRLVIAVSRPRFWPYLAGPYLLGVAASGETNFYTRPIFYLFFLFFLFPANLFLYGINDYYDADTDRFNPKKKVREHLLVPAERRIMQKIVIGAGLTYILVLTTSTSLMIVGLLLLLGLLSYFYSAPPVRFKKRTFIDSASNILYVLPAFIGFAQATNYLPSWRLMLSGALWATAMHLFSAVPDIESDREAGLETTAVYLGHNQSLLACSLLWSFSFICAAESLFSIAPWSLALIAYPFLPIYALMVKKDILKIYWWFPLINALNGALLFIGIMINV